MLNRPILCLIFLGALLLFAACSSTPEIQEFPITANPTEEISRLTRDLAFAKERQADVLSPASFREAERSVFLAAASQKKGDDAVDVLHRIAEGRAYLSRASERSEVSRSNLEAVVAARGQALAAKALQYYPTEFTDADKNLRDVTSDVEDGDLEGAASSRTSLQKQYLDLELKAITHANLGAAKATVATAVKEGAPEFAKQSLAIAEKRIQDTDAFILANRHDTEALKQRSNEAQAAANHLLKITRSSKAGQNISSEETALRLDSEHNTMLSQKQQLAAEKVANANLTTEAGSMKSEQTFNRSFEEARAKFTNDEAEVSRQGDRLIIRLRALEFPTNQSVLKGSNFPLLAKVADVVRGFEDSSVVVEGHTDSVGGKKQNQVLSANRAEAVSMYLVSNNAIEQNRITVDGLGFQKPLATNKTAQGRAQNRRVDVIISPQAEMD